MAPAEEEFVRLLRAEPSTAHQRLARRCGLSGRAARRLVAQHDRERLAKSLRARRAFFAVAGVGLVALGAWTLVDQPDSVVPPSSLAARDAKSVEAERDLYTAIDVQDAAKVERAVEGLTSDDESLRLAALRYLATLRAIEHTRALLGLFDDPSDRLRPVALQLVGRFPGPEVEAKLVDVSLDAARPLSERSLALAALSERDASDPRALTRSLLPGLLDASQPLRDQVVAVLTSVTGQKADVASTSDPARLHEAWRRVVGVVD